MSEDKAELSTKINDLSVTLQVTSIAEKPINKSFLAK